MRILLRFSIAAVLFFLGTPSAFCQSSIKYFVDASSFHAPESLKNAQFKNKDGKIIRRTDGYNFYLVDTNGLCIYVRDASSYVGHSMYSGGGKKGYFSIGLNGKMHDLDYDNLKKYLTPQNKDFLDAVHKIKTPLYFSAEDKNMTLVNSMYRSFSRK